MSMSCLPSGCGSSSTFSSSSVCKWMAVTWPAIHFGVTFGEASSSSAALSSFSWIN